MDLLERGVIGAVRLYQRYLSPMTPPSCRFQPTCSSYMIEAVQVHGTLKGVGMGIWRILRCHPFAKGGYDPVRHNSKTRKRTDQAPEEDS